jgi:FkbH-like protein
MMSLLRLLRGVRSDAARPPAPAPQVAPPRDPMAQRPAAPYPGDVRYRTPDDLAVTQHTARRGLVIGSCFSELLPHYLGWAFPGIETDHLLFNHLGILPDVPPHPIAAYEFQIIMLALRAQMPEALYFRLGYNDIAGHVAAFEEARGRMLRMLDSALAYRQHHPITTFVTNYNVPQQNPMGRLLPRYDLRNPVYFIEQLNVALAEAIANLADVYLVDIDQISANYGRKYLQDDLLTAINHGALISDHDVQFDRNRLEPPQPISHQLAFRVHEFIFAIVHEIGAMQRTLQQVDAVKLVIIDLDDTLWRGVPAEGDYDQTTITEGWPIGFAEALAYLKKRGVLLAIVSKNDSVRIRALWPMIYGNRLELEDFAAIRIDWQPKATNIELILRDLNLLPRSVVFIDDNPVERASVAAAFPDMRVLGAAPYQLRRILLWSAETQVALVSAESARRTEMAQAQIAREGTRSLLSRGEFLDSLGVQVRLQVINSINDLRFPRTLELINKTNQFNTTGRRWTPGVCADAFAAETSFWTFDVADRFTQYGLVGVAIVDRQCITQFVMSCRVVGLDAEIAVIADLIDALGPTTTAAFEPTDANFMCSDLYAKCGFVETKAGWRAPSALPRPAHIQPFHHQSGSG